MRTALSALALLLAVTAAPAFAAAVTATTPAPPAAPTTPAQPSAPPAAAPPSDDILRQKIVGSWGQTPACPDGRLTFNADGSFQSAGANQSDAVTGTYTIDGGHLAGTSGDSEMPTMLVNFDGEMLLLDDGSGSPQRLNRCTTPQ